MNDLVMTFATGVVCSVLACIPSPSSVLRSRVQCRAWKSHGWQCPFGAGAAQRLTAKHTCKTHLLEMRPATWD